MPIATELAIVTTASATDLANEIFGDGITVTSATITGAAGSYATYSGGDATLGEIAPADTGVILSTGQAADFTNSSGTTDTNTSDAGADTTNSTAGDTDLNTVSGQTTADAVVFEADFTPTGDFLTMQFTFSSEEYLEYVNGGVNDAFGVWVNGTYVPFTPASNDLVSIDTINSTSSSNLYLDNPNTADTYNTEMDGTTVVLSIKAPVNDGVTNTIKIALADGGDSSYDSNVLIAGNSIQTVALAFDDSVTLEQNTATSIDVLANDIDASGGGLTITEINGQSVVPGGSVVLPTGETVTLELDGTFTILSSGAIGSEAFTYQVTDSTGTTDIGFVTINTVADLPPDYIVEGTAGNDVINSSYVGDPEGDQVDALDALDGSDDDVIQGFGGDDSISGGGGSNTIFGGTGNDTISSSGTTQYVDGGDDADLIRIGVTFDDTIIGGEGGLDSDTMSGAAANDTLLITLTGNEAGTFSDDDGDFGQFSEIEAFELTAGNDTFDGSAATTAGASVDAGAGNDLITGGGGDDSFAGGSGDDTINLQNGFGADTILGGETGETLGDTLDLSGVTEALTVDLTSANAEQGTVSNGTDTASFAEIENIVLGSGADTVVLADGGGADTVSGFDVSDSGDGTAVDQLDVSGLTSDGGTTPVNTSDVLVSDTNGDGTGDAILTFPGGESITLVGVLASEVDSETELAAIGIPLPLNYIVEGTAGDDTIAPVTYTGDPEGDMVDAGDALDGSDDDFIQAFAGNDDINSGAGNDSVEAGIGNDSVFAGIGDDTVIGDAGDDTIFGFDGADSISGGAGADSLDGDEGSDSIDGGDGADILIGDGGDDTLLGGADNDQIFVSSGNNSIDGGTGDDQIFAGTGADIIFGAAGNDTIVGGAGADSLSGNEDNDRIEGGDDNDTLEGGSGDDTLIGGAGDDSINGDLGNDSLEGGSGDDFLRGSFGDDTLVGGIGNDTLWGGFGDDSIVVDAGFGNYTIEGEEDAEVAGDTMDVSAVTNDLTWDLSNANPEAGSFTDGTSTATFVDIENIVLGSGTDTLVLTTFGGSDQVSGFEVPTDNGDGTFAGNDQLDVSGLLDFDGNATHTGNVTVADDGAGNAVLTFPNGETLTLTGVAVADVSTPAQLIAMGIPEGPDGYVDGTSGDDTIDVNYTGDPNFDRIDNNDAQLPGAAPNDDYVRAGAGNDSVVANAGDDSVEGGTGSDTLEGGGGADTLLGEAGDDSLVGGLGDDSLVGGTGNDTLNGQIGDDVLEGGDGSDSFALEDDFGNDTIVGGEVDDAAGDTLDMSGLGGAISYDLTGVDAESGTVSDGTSTLTFSEIETIVLSSGTDTIVLANGSGDDTVEGFTPPFDDGAGTWVGIDQIDVSTMTDLNGAIVNTGDVTVGDDGAGNAVLNFPGGESLTLIGVSSAAFPVPEALAAIGIPLADYIVEGTAAGELIDSSYLGDPEGDVIDAGDGDPALPDADSDSIEAGGGADTIFAGDGDDTIRGEDGDDLINGMAGNDSIDGGLGNDSIAAGAGADSINAGDGNDTANAGIGDDTIEGGAGDDLMSGAGGDDQIFGGDGDDTILAFDGFGNDTVVGSEVAEVDGDTLDLSGVSAEGVAIDYTISESGIVTGATSGDTIDFSEIENLTATDNADTINAAADSTGVNIDAGDGADTIVGGTGSDTILGGAGNDTISGGEGGDDLSGGAGDDSLNVAQGDTVTGGDGDDYFNIVDLGEAATDTITITGGEGGETDGDTLALNGLHDRDSLVITDPDDVAGGLSGTVTLLDGTVINFSNIENIICFVPGTRIATPSGLRNIEDLKVGDPVVTQDNGVQRIGWVGTSTVAGNDRFAPVRFARSLWPGALDDLKVSPQHRMLVKGYRAELLFGQSEVLVPALHLIDGKDVVQESQDEVTYVHIMFDQHEIVFANGIAAESFHPGAFGVDAMAPKARDELFSLFPNLRSDLTSYGPSARTSLKSREALLLTSY